MPLAGCRSRWITLTAVFLLTGCAVKANHSSRVVSMDGTAAVPCHIAGFDAFPKEIRVSVLRGLRAPQKICTAILNLTESHEKTVTKAEGGNCSAQANVDVLEVTMSGLVDTDTDVYHCVAEILLPPPYIRFQAHDTLVHVIDKSECLMEPPSMLNAQSADPQQDTAPVISVPVAILAVLVLLTLFTMIFLQFKPGKRETVHAVSGTAQKRINAVSCDVV